MTIMRMALYCLQKNKDIISTNKQWTYKSNKMREGKMKTIPPGTKFPSEKETQNMIVSMKTTKNLRMWLKITITSY